jgi:anthranilate synthase/aminodeoxychorismate synthase-like glutamine amidotransferase
VKVFVLDNYDSFTYNLVQYLGELGAELLVKRNDVLTPEQVLELQPAAIVISPGPGRPEDAGISMPLIEAAARRRVPLLGVCLGHQAIGAVFGARVVRADRLMHGKTSEVTHEGQGILRELPSPFTAMRYHSLVVEPDSLPADLEPLAWSTDGELMAMRHRELPIEGVQFHPESIGTPGGKRMLENFLRTRTDDR